MSNIKLNKIKDIDGTEIEWNDIVMDCSGNIFPVEEVSIDTNYVDKIVSDGIYYSPDEVKIFIKHQDRFIPCSKCREFVKLDNTYNGFCQKCFDKIVNGE